MLLREGHCSYEDLLAFKFPVISFFLFSFPAGLKVVRFNAVF
uniref:Uncharacterized protein n=1 Tax=Anguilla anguilla TaxID=7936 RepID=A0A0E9WRF7_ANGAN